MLSVQDKKIIKKHRKEIAEILSGNDERFLVIIGPCSAWPEKALLEYARRLSFLQEELKGRIKIVMRVYTQKPRTNLGWKGILFEPNPCKAPNFNLGLKKAQSLMQEISKMGLAIADEALFLNASEKLLPYLAYLAIGARSSEDQEHRNFASWIDVPVGMKNPSSGDLSVAANSVLAAQSESFHISCSGFKKSSGNKHAHLILRGGKRPNYFKKDILEAIKKLEELRLANPAIIIDTNHANSGKNHLKQISIAKYIIKTRNEDKKIKKAVKGLMIESFLKDGNQKINCSGKMDLEGLSITDPSLGWEKTEELLKWIHDNL